MFNFELFLPWFLQQGRGLPQVDALRDEEDLVDLRRVPVRLVGVVLDCLLCGSVLTANRVGMRPAASSPSNMVAFRAHCLMQIVGTLSLQAQIHLYKSNLYG